MGNEHWESKRWYIVIAAIVMQLCLGAAFAWSMFKNSLIASQSWGDPSFQVTMMIMMAMISVSAAFGGNFVDEKSPRFVAAIGGILLGLGALLSGMACQAGNMQLFIIGYGIIGGLGIGFCYITTIATLIRWFPDKRGLVTGLAVLGFGAGAALIGYFGPCMVNSLGVANTFFISGVIFLIFVTGAAQVCENPPPGWLPAGFTPDETVVSAADSFSFGEAIKTPQWWMLWAMFFLNVIAGIGFILQLSPLAQFVLKKIVENITVEELVRQEKMIIILASVFIGLGPLCWAAISDHISRRSVMITIFSSQFMLYIFQPYVSYVMQFAGIACFLLSCLGGGFAVTAAFAADSFGPGSIGKVYGFMLPAGSCAGILGSFLFNIPEIKPITLYVVAGLVLLGTLVASFYMPPERKQVQQ